MVFSLVTGEWIRTVFAPTGDGPAELSNGKTGLALAPNGGLYISGYLRVLEFDSLGTRINTWTPVRPPTTGVCDFDGEPAVPTHGGVVRRGPEYQDQNIGPVATARGRSAITGPREEAIATGLALMSDTRIACSEDAAYVFTAIDNEPGTLTVYQRDGTVSKLTIPSEDAKEGGCSIREIRNGQQVIQRGGSWPALVTARADLLRRTGQPRPARRRCPHPRRHHQPRDGLLRAHPHEATALEEARQHPLGQRAGLPPLLRGNRTTGRQHSQRRASQLGTEGDHQPDSPGQRGSRAMEYCRGSRAVDMCKENMT